MTTPSPSPFAHPLCSNCEVAELILETVTETYTAPGGQQITVEGIQFGRCPVCREEIMDPPLLRANLEKVRQAKIAAGLLTP